MPSMSATKTQADSYVSKALQLAALGLPVFPCGQNKTPLVEHGFKAATTDAATIRGWWQKWPHALVGMPTGATSDVVVLDLDRKKGKDGVEAVEGLALDLPPAPIHLTQSGGEHRLYRYPGHKIPCGSDLLKTLVGTDATGIDIRGDGGYIIVWGEIDAKMLANLPVWPEAFEDALRRDDIEKRARHEYPRQQQRYDGPADLDRIHDALACIPADDHDAWVSVGMALHSELGDAGREIWANWSQQSSKYDAHDLAKRWRSFRGGGVTIASLFHHARANGWRPSAGRDAGHSAREMRQDRAPAGVGHNSDGPLPLIREMPRGEEYPVEALGPVLSGMARALHEEAVRAPLALCGTAVLAATALAVQGHADVTLPTGQTVPTSLYFLTIAASGERKSSCDSHALKPVREREAELRDEYDSKMDSWRNRHDAWMAEREKIKKDKKLTLSGRRGELENLGAEPQRPASPLLTLSEPTIEGAIRHWQQSYPSTGIFTTEGGQFIGGHGFSDEAKMRTAGAFNKLWDGAPLERVRATGDAVILPGRRVSIHLQAQHDVAMKMLTDRALIDIGLLARFLITEPESTMGQRLRRQVSDASKLAMLEYGTRSLRILQHPLPMAEGKVYELAPRAVPLSAEAANLWDAFSDHVEQQLAPGGDLRPISGLANKAPEHAARIATGLALFDDIGCTEVSVAHLRRGIELVQYHISEAIRLLGIAHVSTELADAQILLDWLHKKWGEQYVTIKQIVRLGPAAIRDTETARTLVAVLTGHNWLIPAPAGTVVAGTASREVWQIVRGEA